MKRAISYFVFIPFINRFILRKYYATGLGTYIVNSVFKRILRISSKGDFLLHFTSRVNSPGSVIVKNGKDSSTVYLSLATSISCYYQGVNGIEFGEGTIWANGCSFISANHSFKDLTTHISAPKISIGKYVWIGSNSSILPGVVIGDNTIVGAGSVVLKSFPENSIIAGVPAKIIAKRCSSCLDKTPNIKSINLCQNCMK